MAVINLVLALRAIFGHSKTPGPEPAALPHGQANGSLLNGQLRTCEGRRYNSLQKSQGRIKLDHVMSTMLLAQKRTEVTRQISWTGHGCK